MSYPYYILVDKKVVKTDMEGYIKWDMENPGASRIDFTLVRPDVNVSTVFLMIDHGYGVRDESKPVVFETMVFGGELDQDGERYTSYEDAMAGHKRWVHKVRGEWAKRQAN